MKIWKPALSLMLTAALSIGLLAGCNQSGGETSDTSSTADGSAELDDGTVTDLPLKLIGVSADTVLFTVNGNPVTAEDYVYWLGYGISYYQNNTNSGADIDWTQTTSDGESLADYFKDGSYSTCVLYNLIAAKATEMSLTLTDTDEQAITDKQSSTIEQLGGQEEYERNLRRAGISEDKLLEITRATYYYTYLADALYGQGTDGYPTDEEMDQYIEENGWMYAKHILLLTQTAASDATDEEKASIDAANNAQLELANSLSAQLKANSDPATLFDTLMNQYSEDTGLSSYPNGYTFTSGQMESAFEDAVEALEIGGISDVVQISYGYDIIERLDPDTDDLREQYAKDQLSDQLDTWTGEADIEYVNQAAYDNIDVQKFYEDLSAYWASVDAIAESNSASATDTGSGTLEATISSDASGTTDAAITGDTGSATDAAIASDTSTSGEG
ncbi:MAG: hypothetical protein H6Q60_1090 [Oscillospiraceae bacterium]|nr:hypothetical protein [Oscillospiraceae bacterium]